ncbi:MAG: hypothetical protein LZF86_10147 [Nitrospira sp.]|nr:MAG: hypothetical protein LZF86_10147 [Nitrospira sp.]
MRSRLLYQRQYILVMPSMRSLTIPSAGHQYITTKYRQGLSILSHIYQWLAVRLCRRRD